MTTFSDRRQGNDSGAAVKAPCLVATTADITLSGLQAVDGVTVAANDRVLVKSQDTASENGIYLASSSTWTRAPDFSGAFDVMQGTLVRVVQGSTLGGSTWEVTTASPTLGAALAWGRTDITTADAELAALAALTSAADQLPYFTGSGTAALASFLTLGKSLLAAANAAAARTALGLGSAAVLDSDDIPDILDGISGLIGTNNATDDEHDLDFSTGVLRTGGVAYTLASAITKRFDATFSEGDGNGGMANGVSLPTSGTVHLGLVTKDADGTVDIIGDTSVTGANTDSGWTWRGRIGSMCTDSMANFYLEEVLEEAGGNVLHERKEGSIDVTTSSLTNTYVDYSLPLPADLTVRTQLVAGVSKSGAAQVVLYLRSPNATGVQYGQLTAPVASQYQYGLVDTIASDGDISIRSSHTSTSLLMQVARWHDRRV